MAANKKDKQDEQDEEIHAIPPPDLIPGIPDTMENVARAIMQGRPKKVWRYIKKGKENGPD